MTQNFKYSTATHFPPDVHICTEELLLAQHTRYERTEALHGGFDKGPHTHTAEYTGIKWMSRSIRSQ